MGASTATKCRSLSLLPLCSAVRFSFSREQAAALSANVRAASSSELAQGPALAPPEDLDPADPAALIFTSGTSGEAKAVVLSFGNLLASAIGSILHLVALKVSWPLTLVGAPWAVVPLLVLWYDALRACRAPAEELVEVSGS